MLGILTRDQSIQFLRGEVVGRIGCYADGKVYIVPVTYVFEEGYVYAHSKEGLKVVMMRKNPQVCFQVEHMENMANWRSVIIWGRYEELKTRAQQAVAMKYLRDRLAPLVTSEAVKPSHSFHHDLKSVQKPYKAVAFRISIEEISGRFEKK